MCLQHTYTRTIIIHMYKIIMLIFFKVQSKSQSKCPALCVTNAKHFPASIYYSIFVFMLHLIDHRIAVCPLHFLALIEQPVALTHTSSQKIRQGRMCERAATDSTNETAYSHVIRSLIHSPTHSYTYTRWYIFTCTCGWRCRQRTNSWSRTKTAVNFSTSPLSLSQSFSSNS